MAEVVGMGYGVGSLFQTHTHTHDPRGLPIPTLGPMQVVFKGPVRSSLFPFLGKTETKLVLKIPKFPV